MEREEKIDLFWDLFVNRTDSYTAQRFSKKRNGWEFWRQLDKETKQPVPFTRQHILDHLNGVDTYGVYQLDENDQVKWLCFDIDIDKGEDKDDYAWDSIKVITKSLRQALNQYKVPHLLEFSGSRGMHVWVFFADRVPAAKAQALGQFLLQDVEVPEGFHIELFPKSTALMGGVGHVVKLPMGVHKKSGKRTRIIADNQWEALASVGRITPKGLDLFMAKFDIKVQERIPTGEPVDGGRGLPCYTNLLREGCSEGGRDELTFRLAVFLRTCGFPSDSAVSTITGWNSKNVPPLSDEEIMDKVESAYKREYKHWPCQVREFDTYCEETCLFYKNKMKFRNKN